VQLSVKNCIYLPPLLHFSPFAAAVRETTPNFKFYLNLSTGAFRQIGKIHSQALKIIQRVSKNTYHFYFLNNLYNIGRFW